MFDITAETWAITGSAGAIGRDLRAHLRSRVAKLVLIDLVPSEDLAANERNIVADLRDEGATLAALDGCHGVVHLGGLADEADFHDLAEVNIVGSYHVLEAARRNGLRRVVFASSNRATGFYPAGRAVDVTMPPRPDGLYGVAKAAIEALCSLYADKFGLSTISIRIGTYATEPTNSRELSTWLSHEDALRAFDAAMTTDSHYGAFYGVSRNDDRWWDLTAGEAMGFYPQDNARAVLPELAAVPAEEPQGGLYASPEYTLAVMRSEAAPPTR